MGYVFNTKSRDNSFVIHMRLTCRVSFGVMGVAGWWSLVVSTPVDTSNMYVNRVWSHTAILAASGLSSHCLIPAPSSECFSSGDAIVVLGPVQVRKR